MKGSHGENMNILKKGSTALLLFVLLLMALPVFGASPENSAQTVDPAVPGKILIRYRAGADGTKPVAGASFTVYRIAETGSFGKMTGLSFGPDGKRFSVDEKTDPRRIEAAVREAYRGSVDGGFTRTQTTGREGDAVFSDLPHGVYLVSETASAEGYRPSSAFLVTVPWSDVEKDADGGESWCWHYEAEAYPKAEPVPVYPETGDESSLLLYGFLAGASALMLILILRGRKMHGKRKKPGVLTALALCMALLAGCLAGPAAVFAGPRMMPRQTVAPQRKAARRQATAARRMAETRRKATAARKIRMRKLRVRRRSRPERRKTRLRRRGPRKIRKAYPKRKIRRRKGRTRRKRKRAATYGSPRIPGSWTAWSAWTLCPARRGDCIPKRSSRGR